MQKYRLFDHTADIGLEIFGRTKKELLANSACALQEIVLADAGHNVPGKRRTLTVEGTELADLLVNFLREILYLFNGEALVIKECEITQCSTKKMKANLLLEPHCETYHRIKTEIKAVTYHGLKVKKTKNGWVARVIFDV